jgi:TatD DNase family protein
VRSTLPPLDCHAHVDTSIDVDRLRSVRAVVVAVTREPNEWVTALERRDPTAVWGIGAHPGVPAALRDFDAGRFAEMLDQTLFVGEIGLDGRARTDRVAQARVFASVLQALAEQPRPATIHSTSATGEVLAALRRNPVPGAILHWWRGTVAETREAIDLGCFFSINGHELAHPKILDQLPPDRVLPETDFPHSKRYDRAAQQPGATQTVEAGLAHRWGVDEAETRRRLWLNFGEVLTVGGVLNRMPRAILAALAAAGYDG